MPKDSFVYIDPYLTSYQPKKKINKKIKNRKKKKKENKKEMKKIRLCTDPLKIEGEFCRIGRL